MTENVLHGKDFSELILRDLINEGYVGKELFDEFNIRQSEIRPRVEAMLREEKLQRMEKANTKHIVMFLEMRSDYVGISYSFLWQRKVKKILKVFF